MAGVLVLSSACSPSGEPAGGDEAAPTIELELLGEGAAGRRPAVFRVTGLSASTTSRLAQLGLDDRQWSRIFAVHVGDRSRPAILGQWRLGEGEIEFRPDFALEPALVYHSVFDSDALALVLDQEPTSLIEGSRRDFELPGTAQDRHAEVVAIYPSSDRLPENLLKFYLHFSAPMSQGNSYRFISILDANGEPVELAILELEHELWDPHGRRLTLLFDPGRIKTGLRPRREVGRALQSDFDFSLVVDEAWPDARGVAMKNGYLKRFSVLQPDHVSPDPSRWRIVPPPRDSRQHLLVDLDEPLDEALLQRMLWIEGPDQATVPGTITTEQHEQRWLFLPDRPWIPGRHTLAIDQRLEDRSGNSIHRLFEVDLQAGRRASEVAASITRLHFEVR